MRKTLLIAAAALAAGVISSQAQVYSQNIVGYVNSPLPAGFVNIANPLDAADTSGVNNTITNIINVFSGNYDSDSLYIWTGATYAQYTIDSGWPTGIGNAADSAAVAPPTIAPGQSIFIDNVGTSNTLTFVGTVHSEGVGASTNVVGLTTNTLPSSPQFSYVSSKIAIGGGVSSVLQLPANGSLDSCVIYIPNIVGGAVHGFNQVTIDSGWSTGFGNAADSAQVPEPIIPVGTGFFFYNVSGAPVKWVQSL
jgi:hypothetical protein